MGLCVLTASLSSSSSSIVVVVVLILVVTQVGVAKYVNSVLKAGFAKLVCIPVCKPVALCKRNDDRLAHRFAH